MTHLGSLPLDLLLGIGIFWHPNGSLLRRERWVGEQFPGLEALPQELVEVLIFKLDRVPNRTQRGFPVSLHAGGTCTVKRPGDRVWNSRGLNSFPLLTPFPASADQLGAPPRLPAPEGMQSAGGRAELEPE